MISNNLANDNGFDLINSGILIATNARIQIIYPFFQKEKISALVASISTTN